MWCTATDHCRRDRSAVFGSDANQLQEVPSMGNEQQNEGRLEQARGTIKEKVGQVTDNERMQREGEYDKAKGNVREGIGDAREGIDKTVDAWKRDR
jgi:uncharacterized protein YjbJ (UPF0337 family)